MIDVTGWDPSVFLISFSKLSRSVLRNGDSSQASSNKAFPIMDVYNCFSPGERNVFFDFVPCQ